ncbi:hypothetical protein E4U09_001974 [Claviceps aff. purpurea]|uniref:Uncharacterized protein n=1 Tax=Claviceps aff. purpurea TaxID=1967640 RepID=A0A9P7QIE9_9HYPO|nr:hypothetical protein E4U09_001974 [Claviceps aff. purpurea]
MSEHQSLVENAIKGIICTSMIPGVSIRSWVRTSFAYQYSTRHLGLFRFYLIQTSKMPSPNPGRVQKTKSKPKPEVGPWAPRMIDDFRKGNAEAAKLPHTTFRDGSSKKSRMAVHVYPDGRVTLFHTVTKTAKVLAKDIKSFRANKATVEEMGGIPQFLIQGWPLYRRTGHDSSELSHTLSLATPVHTTQSHD